MSFLDMNAIKTLVRENVVSQSSAKNPEKLIFGELLRCNFDRINYIHMSFVHTNAIETITTIGVVSPFSKNE